MYVCMFICLHLLLVHLCMYMYVWQATESFGRLLQDVVGNESRAIAIKTAADHSKLRSAGGGKSMQHTAGAYLLYVCMYVCSVHCMYDL